MDTILNLIKPLFEMYSGLIPDAVIGVLAFVGTLRLVIKPALSLAYAVAGLTPSGADDAAIKKIEDGKIMKTLKYALDWLASIKFPVKKK